MTVEDIENLFVNKNTFYCGENTGWEMRVFGMNHKKVIFEIMSGHLKTKMSYTWKELLPISYTITGVYNLNDANS